MTMLSRLVVKDTSKRLCLFVLFSVLVGHTPIARAQPADLITWYKPEFPPLSIVNGPDAGKGYSDRIEAFLIENLKSYRHETLVSPFKRTVRDMQKGLNACSVTLLKTKKRAEFIAFTKPARLLLPNSLIVRVEERDSFSKYAKDADKVSVEEIIKAGERRIGYSNGRSYTKPLDDLLKKYAGKENLVERLGNEGPKGLLSMLSKGRIDAMFAQPVEAQFHGRQLGLGDRIAVLPIHEIKDYTVGYIGCAKTPWGSEVIKRIDRIIDTAVKDPAFRSFYEEFLDPPSVARYRRVYNAYFGLE